MDDAAARRAAEIALAAGRPVEAIAAGLLGEDLSPIAVIKVLQLASGLGLAELKVVVDGCLPEAQRRNNERLREGLMRALEEFDRSRFRRFVLTQI